MAFTRRQYLSNRISLLDVCVEYGINWNTAKLKKLKWESFGVEILNLHFKYTGNHDEKIKAVNVGQKMRSIKVKWGIVFEH